MKIKDFPYGKITKTLIKAVDWLNKNKKKLEKEQGPNTFDYPNYWDMPKTISSRLSGDEVDWLQAEIYNWKFEEFHKMEFEKSSSRLQNKFNLQQIIFQFWMENFPSSSLSEVIDHLIFYLKDHNLITNTKNKDMLKKISAFKDLKEEENGGYCLL